MEIEELCKKIYKIIIPIIKPMLSKFYVNIIY